MRDIVKIDGGGADICGHCQGRVDYSWQVTYTDGGREPRCSLHVMKGVNS